MERTISRFTINRNDGKYLLQFEDEDGETTELTANFDQLDLIAEAINGALDKDEETELSPDGDREAAARSDNEA